VRRAFRPTAHFIKYPLKQANRNQGAFKHEPTLGPAQAPDLIFSPRNKKA